MKRDVYELAGSMGLSAMRPLELRQGMSTADVLEQMSNTAFTGRTLGEAASVLQAMLQDESCKVVLTVSGAMTMAGLGGLILLAVKRGWVHCIVATGALLGHGMVESLGLPHFKADPSLTDEEYFTVRLNRIYDTLEPEQNLDELEEMVRGLLDELCAEGGDRLLGTADMLRYLGENLPGGGLLQAAARERVPIFIPAFTDSELGLDFAVHQMFCQRENRPSLRYDGFVDLEQFRLFCEEATATGQKLGIFTIGGGVPRNWAQQIGPYVDVRNTRLRTNAPRIRYSYGVRICPDPVHYGHLSGCTYSEGVSWGKFIPRSEGGRYAEVLLDATVGWPLLVQAMLDRGL